MSPVAKGSAGPLVVRLRNWVGDAVLTVPTLARLEQAGYDLHLVGRGWVGDLLGGYGWKAHRLEATRRGRIAQWRALRRDLGPDARAIVLPYAFSAALEARLGGFAATGFAGQCRGWLLGQSVPLDRSAHTLVEYWALGQAFLGSSEPPPSDIRWRFSPSAEAEAVRLREANGLRYGYVVLVPFASGGADDRRVWPHFPALSAELVARGVPVALCPGSPAEAAAAAARYPGARIMEGVGMSAYGVLMRDAARVVACDTGPGHLAAAAGARLLSIFGPSVPARWSPVGPSAELICRWPEWPSLEEVLAKSLSPSSP